MSLPISGLGIDMGPPLGFTNANRKRAHTIDASSTPEYTESLNQYNDQRLQSLLPARRPTSSSALPQRILSKKSADARSQGYRMPDGSESDSSSTSGQSSAKRYTSGPMNRHKRLSVAVANLSDQAWDKNSSCASSDLYSSDASPETVSSVSSYSSGAKSGTSSLKRNMTVRKQASQPDLGSAATLVSTETLRQSLSALRLSNGPPRADVALGMVRSKSTVEITSFGKEGSTSLGRSNEIPRSGSRVSTYQRSRGRHVRSATWDPRSAAVVARENNGGLIPDGFGGYVEAEQAEEQIKPGSVLIDASSPLEARQESESSPPVPEQEEQDSSPNLAKSVSSHSVVSTLRVGTFYAPDGSEVARLEEEDYCSRLGSSQSGSSVGHSSVSSKEMQSTTSSQRSQSQRPRLQFMSSPGNYAGKESEADNLVDHEAVIVKSYIPKSVSQGNIRSHRGWKGLEGAERGETMISLDAHNNSFAQGEVIGMQLADHESILGSAMIDPTQRLQGLHKGYVSDNGADRRAMTVAPILARSMTEVRSTTTTKIANASQLDRQSTLISASNPARRSKELNRLLANNGGRKLASSSASISAGESVAGASNDRSTSARPLSRSNAVGQFSAPPATLEQSKMGKSRVDVDLVLESELVVEGGILSGRLEIKVRKNSDKDGPLMLTQPKVRVVGFEELLNDDTRHIFYHHATVIDGSPKIGSGPFQPYVLHGTPSLSPEADNRRPLACFASPADSEGFCVAKDGSHSIPFTLELPVGKGAKGSFRGKHAIVRYIVIGSVKLKSANGSNRSIAHFYRHVDLYPYLNPAVILSSSSRPVQANASKGLFLGGSGKVHLAASLHRSTWVAGQRIYVNIKIDNETNKKVKNLSLALVRTVTLYRPRPEFDMRVIAPDDPSETYVDPDACTTSTSRKKISEEVLEMGQKGAKGLVTARGWWTGVEGGESIEFSHNMKLPNDTLTITRGRHVEVQYSLKVSISSSLSSDVSVELPVRVVNFVSMDPPPLKSSSTKVTKNWSRDNHQRNAMSETEAPMIDRMRAMECHRSNSGGYDAGLGLEPVNHMKQQQQQQQHIPPPPPLSFVSRSGNTLQVPGGLDSAKRVQHQKSLDFINHAIRSATARRGSQTRSTEASPTGLGIELDRDRTPPADYSYGPSSSDASSIVSSAAGSIDPSCAPYEHGLTGTRQQQSTQQSKQYTYGHYQHPVNLPMQPVSMDDVGDDSDLDLGVGSQTLNLNDESVMEVDYVIGSAQIDGGESSPAFQQRKEFGVEDMPVYEEDDNDDDEAEEMEGEEDVGNTSTSTVTHRSGAREEDEYDEEEERLERQRRIASQNLKKLVILSDLKDDDSTPLARSPPKFQGTATSSTLSSSSSTFAAAVTGNRPAVPPKQRPSLSRLRTNESEEEYMSSSSTSSRRSVVRTESDLDSTRLERRSTIIRGPNGDVTRPVSPSKQAPVPKKSALKSKSSFTFATSAHPLKAAGVSKSGAKSNLNKPLPVHVKAKVDARQASKIVIQRGMPVQASTKAPTQQQQQILQQRMSSIKRASMSSGARAHGADDVESNASTSPDTSDSAVTPESTYHAMMRGNTQFSQARENLVDAEDSDISMRMHTVDVALKKTMADEITIGSMTSLTTSTSAPALARSTSTHNLRGNTVVVPSVRDKIALLESRKQALKDFTGTSSMTPSPSNSNCGTPTRFNAGINRGSNNTTPTRVQTAARQHLERNNSVLSDASSQADYLRHTPSFANFKAPLFNLVAAPALP
ncbi:hypothetical protein CBS101457_005988 [Exobasidium rhododendri]|nr:hypothetical protein CBS101457_005988 [Exobasidium rhododendri]